MLLPLNKAQTLNPRLWVLSPTIIIIGAQSFPSPKSTCNCASTPHSNFWRPACCGTSGKSNFEMTWTRQFRRPRVYLLGVSSE